MAHIGFLCPPIPGHLNPIATLARALAKRGHRTTAFQIPEARNAIEAQQLEFQPLGEGQADTRAIADAVAKLGTLTGVSGVKFTVRCAASLANTICRYGPATIQNSSVELLVVDQNEPAGASVAQHLGLPFLNVLSGLPLNREPKIPPPFVPWGYTGRMTTTVFNAAAYSMFDRLVAPVNRVLNEHRRNWKLAPIQRPDDTFSELAQLSQLTEDLDFPRVSKPAALYYLGPFRDSAGLSVSFPYERLNGKPLAYASFGTLQTGNKESFQLVAAACAELDVQLVISTGHGCALDPTQLAGQPLVVEYAPQRDLLERAAVCITHGGMNTVLDALSCGVPMVALPVTNDQPAIAARVRYVGAGEVLFPRRLTPTRLRAAVRRVLEDPAYRARARQLKTSIERAGGVGRAADIVENVLARTGSGRAIPAA
jgi:UDP:flavonoid glycosyltransferase YjiC (YdhE family)